MKPKFRAPRRTALATIIFAGAFAVISSPAATLTWDSDTGTSGAQDGGGSWTAGGATFWDGSANVATTNDLTTDIAQFGNGGTLAAPAVIDVSTQSINGLIFAPTVDNGYNLTATTPAQVLSVGASGIVINAGAQATTLGSANLSLALGAAQSWANDSSSLFTVGGNIDNGANLLTVGGTGNSTISGVIGSGGVVTGGLEKTGAGTLTLSGTNAYTGGTSISGGTLALNGAGTLGATTNTLTFTAAAILDLGGTTQTQGNIVYTGTSGVVTDTLQNGSLILSGASNMTVGPAGTGTASYTLDAAALGSLAITKPANTLNVNGGSTAGALSQSATLKLSAASNEITVAALNVGTIGGAVSGVNNGTLQLGASNAINATNIQVGGTRSNGSLSFQTGLSSPTVTLRGVTGGESRVTGFIVGQNGAGGTPGNTATANFSLGTIDARIINLTISQGTSTATTGNPPSVNGIFTMGQGTLDATSINISDNTIGGGNSTNMGTFNQNAGSVTVGTLTLGRRAGTTLTPILLPTYNLGTSTQSATLNAQTIQAGTGTVSTSTVRNLNFNNGIIRNFDAATDLSINGTGTATSTRLNVVLGSAANTTRTFFADANRTITVGANTLISGSGGLTKDGAGNLTLGAGNTFTGETLVSEGNLVLTAVGAIRNGATNTITIEDGGTLTIGVQSLWGNYVAATPLTPLIINAGGTVTNNGAFGTPLGPVTLNGGTLTSTGGQNGLLGAYVLKGLVTVGGSVPSTITGNGTNTFVVLGSSPTVTGTVFDVSDATGDAASDLTVSTPMQNGFSAGSTFQASSLTKTGAGTMELQSASLYTGGTNIRNGTILLTGGNNRLAANGPVTIGDATTTGKLVLGNTTAAVNQQVSTLTATGLGGNVVGGNALTSSVLTVNSGTYTGILGGAGANENMLALTKATTGSLTLSGDNTYTGGTTFAAGVITASSNTALGTGTVTFDGGARLLVTDGVTLANDIVIGANTGTAGNGLLQIATSGTATLSGDITINNLAAGGGHFGTTGTAVLNLTGAITSTSVTVSHRTGTVVYSGGGSYENLTINQGIAVLGANNGLATNAAINIGPSGSAILDLAGFNQSIVGITRGGGSATTVGNSSTTADSTLTTTGTSSYSGEIADAIGSGTRKVNVMVNGGSLTLTGTNTYTGTTTVSAGSLIINGAVASTSVVADAYLGGSGSLANATISGSGSVNPGNSPGIMTAAATDPTGGLDYNFELTTANTPPVWSNASASVNDVIRLTAVTPFSADLTQSNIVSLYLGASSFNGGEVFTGGFFTDTDADFLSSISNATFLYFLSDVDGATTYQGGTYTAYTGSLGISVATVAVPVADFASGAVDGYVTQFTVEGVPEPSTALMGVIGLLAILRRRR